MVVVTLAALLVSACAGQSDQAGQANPGDPAPPQQATDETRTAVTEEIAQRREQAMAGARVEIPAIDVSTSLVSLGLNDDRTMEVPTDFAAAGWYRYGPTPGEDGPSVIAGHVDSHTGPAVFYRLTELQPGDEVQVDGAEGPTTFVVDRVEQHPKDAFPHEEVYGDTPGPQLRLITCGGVFDEAQRAHRDNIIVYASAVGA